MKQAFAMTSPVRVRRVTRFAYVALASGLAHNALADPVASINPPPPSPEPLPAPQPSEPTAADVANQPVPGAESGRTDQVDTGDSAGRVIARAVLWPPKFLFEAITEPLYGASYAFDKYDLENRYYRLFYNRDRTIGIVPTASYATGFGPIVGAQFIDLDTFGDKEHAGADVQYGGTYHDEIVASIDTGHRLGRVVIGLVGSFEQYPALPFYGIGNKNTGPELQSANPATAPTAFGTDFRYQEDRAMLSVDTRVVSAFHVIARGGLSKLDYGRSTSGIPIDQVYNPDELTGFVDGPRHAYGELELRWDDRDRATIWEPRSVHTTGTLASVFAGDVVSLNSQPDFVRYGFDLQQGFHLAAGPRGLIFRLLGEGVTGNIDQVPFPELPFLGGDYLRGYAYGRFRDRVAMLGTAEYLWDISHNLDAYLFVDEGRVYDSLSTLAFSNMRTGFGVGLELHNDAGFLVEGSIATSVDGGLFLTADFRPVLDTRPRWR